MSRRTPEYKLGNGKTRVFLLYSAREMVRWLIEIFWEAQMTFSVCVEVEFFKNFAEVYLVGRGGGPLLAHFHTEQYRKAFRKKAKKFASRFAKKNGGLEVKIIDHTNEVENEVHC